MVEAGLNPANARGRFYAVGLDGLLVEGTGNAQESQRRFMLPRECGSRMRKLRQPNAIDLLDVIENAKPTALIGVTGQPGVSSPRKRDRARHGTRRQSPDYFPALEPHLSRAEADPADIMRWTEGRAIIATGSHPFTPVERNGKLVPVDQCNNSYIFSRRRDWACSPSKRAA